MVDEAAPPSLFYKRHVFFCTNERPDGHPRGCCKAKGAEKLRNYMKARAKEMGLEHVRKNSAGCLDRCELGTTMVIYLEGIWYRCNSMEVIDCILSQHLKNGNRVLELMLWPNDN